MVKIITHDEHIEWLHNQYNEGARVKALDRVTHLWNNADLVYGQWDCVNFIAMCMIEMGYENPLKNIKNYKTEKQANNVILSMGYEHLDEILNEKFPILEHRLDMVVGDIVALKSGKKRMNAMGIHIGYGIVWGYYGLDGKLPKFQSIKFMPETEKYFLDTVWRLI